MFLPSKRIKKKKKFWLNLLHKERTWILLSFVWPVLLFYTGCESHIAGGVAQCPRVNSSFVDLVSHFLTFRCAKLFTSPPQQKWEAARGGGEILSSSRSRPLKEKKSFGVTMCACTRWLYMRVYVYVRRRRRRRRAEAYMAREKERAAAADPPSIESTRKKMRFFFFFPCARARLRLVEWYVQCHLQLEPIHSTRGEKVRRVEQERREGGTRKKQEKDGWIVECVLKNSGRSRGLIRVDVAFRRDGTARVVKEIVVSPSHFLLLLFLLPLRTFPTVTKWGWTSSLPPN